MTAGELCRCVKQLLDHVPHLVNLVFDVLLRVLGEGHVAVSAKEDNPQVTNDWNTVKRPPSSVTNQFRSSTSHLNLTGYLVGSK